MEKGSPTHLQKKFFLPEDEKEEPERRLQVIQERMTFQAQIWTDQVVTDMEEKIQKSRSEQKRSKSKRKC